MKDPTIRKSRLVHEESEDGIGQYVEVEGQGRWEIKGFGEVDNTFAIFIEKDKSCAVACAKRLKDSSFNLLNMDTILVATKRNRKILITPDGGFLTFVATTEGWKTREKPPT